LHYLTLSDNWIDVNLKWGKETTPALISPRNTQIVPSNNITFTWMNNPFSTYHFEISEYPEFLQGMLVFSSDIQARSITMPNLRENTKYYWRVRYNVGNPDINSSWSSVWSFTTGDPTSVENEVVLKNDLLKEASPNPVINKTTINFTVEKAGAVSLKRFDLYGKEVATLTD